MAEIDKVSDVILPPSSGRSPWNLA